MASDKPVDEETVRAAIDVLLHCSPVAAALARVGVFIVDHTAGTRIHNDLHHELGLADDAYPTPTSWLDRVHPDDRARVEAEWNDVLAGGSNIFSCEYRFADSTGDYHWLRNRGTVVFRTPSGDPWLYVAADTDLSEIRRVQARLAEATITDPVLEILNRRGLQDRGQRIAERHHHSGQTLGVLVIDIDHFKQINDEAGHDAADQIMKQLVDAARSSIRPGDLIGRFGGDEFVVLLPNADQTEASRIADRISAEAGSVDRRGLSFAPSITVGVAAGVPEANDGFWELFRRADEELMHTKRNRSEDGG